MKHHIEIRIDVETKHGCTVEDWEEYRDALISKIRAAHDWNGFNKVFLKKLTVHECTERKGVRNEP